MKNSQIIVQKYGGSSLAQPEQIQAIADQIKILRQDGFQVLLVVSAMGKSTDQLVELAHRVSPSPHRRELDMLLTTGERISMALMSMALIDRGIPAISLTGSQAGVLTDDRHSNARIIDLKPMRVESELTRGRLIVLAGFQGVSPSTKEITTLGRGGSDTTAVAMAAYFKAQKCEIKKDVDGIYSADPNLVEDTVHLENVHPLTLLDMTFWGAKVLHYRSCELAHLLKIPLSIGLAHGESKGTTINHEAPMYEQAQIISVNSHKSVFQILVKKADLADALGDFTNELNQSSLPMPQLLDSEKHPEGWTFLITAASETLHAIDQLCARIQQIECLQSHLSTITATCQGAFASSVPFEISKALTQANVKINKFIFGSMSITAVITSNDRERCLQLIHNLRLT